MSLLETALSPAAILGAKSRRGLHYLAILSLFIYLPVRRTLFPPYFGFSSIFRTTVMQIYFTGVQALWLFLFLGLVTGMSLSMIKTASMTITAKVCSIILKEVVPILVAFIILGRSGTAITVELGNMTVLRELRQLRMMGIDPYRHVVFPRMMGVTTATLFLGFFFSTCIAVVTGLSSGAPLPAFFKELLESWRMVDIIIISEKGILYGLIISMVACYQGLNLVPMTTEVPKATIKTVIHCILLCTTADFLFKILGV